LAAMGLDRLISFKSNQGLKRLWALGGLGMMYLALWILVLMAPSLWPQADWLVNLAVTKRNLILPTGLLGLFLALVQLPELMKGKFNRRT